LLQTRPRLSVRDSRASAGPRRRAEARERKNVCALPSVTRYSENAAMDEYAAFAAIYDDWASHMTEDVPFYLELVREADGPVVELAVGNGRVAIPVAQETGRRVVGIDSSPAMLAQARERAVEAGVELDLREGDIRELEIEEPAALIYCPGRSLLHLPTWADRRRCFEGVAASLRPNGRFAWNAFAFDHQIAAAADGQHADPTPGMPVPHINHYSVSDNRVDMTLDD